MKTAKIMKWMRKNKHTQGQIGRELGISQPAVHLTIYNKSTVSRVMAWLREHGCPEEYLNKKRK